MIPNLGHPILGRGGKKTRYFKSEHSDKQTDRQTNIWTNQLIESIGPESQCFEKNRATLSLTLRVLVTRLNLKNSLSSFHSLVALWRKEPSIWRTLNSSQDLELTRSTSLVSFLIMGRWGFLRESIEKVFEWSNSRERGMTRTHHTKLSPTFGLKSLEAKRSSKLQLQAPDILPAESGLHLSTCEQYTTAQRIFHVSG